MAERGAEEQQSAFRRHNSSGRVMTKLAIVQEPPVYLNLEKTMSRAVPNKDEWVNPGDAVIYKPFGSIHAGPVHK